MLQTILSLIFRYIITNLNRLQREAIYLLCLCCKLSFFRAVESGKNVLQRDQIKLMAPITDPGKILCIGMNYRDHCEEQNLPVPKEPVVFSKFNSAIIGPSDAIKYPSETEVLISFTEYPTK